MLTYKLSEMIRNKETYPKDNVVKKILITQPKPENDKSPYFELARKHNIELQFHPFIAVDSIAANEFRKQKIDISKYTAVIFTSRLAIDHFFRMTTEMKTSISQDMKYFCITEAIALYLQNFILLYRKRKVLFGADGTNQGLFEIINKHKDNEKFLYPCSEFFDNEITIWLKNHNCEYVTPVLFKIVSNDIKEVVAQNFDVICLFTPGSVKSLLENFPHYKQNRTRIGVFGANTSKAAEDAGLILQIKAPQPLAQSMVSALELYLTALEKKIVTD